MFLFDDDPPFVDPIRPARPLCRDVPRKLENSDELRRCERIAARETFKHYRHRAASETGRVVLGALRSIRLGRS